MVQKVPFLRRCSTAVIHAVIVRLKAEVYLEGDFVILAGNPGYAMYFIVRGECSVLVSSSRSKKIMRRIENLVRHDHFGELALLDGASTARAHVLAETVIQHPCPQIVRRAFSPMPMPCASLHAGAS